MEDGKARVAELERERALFDERLQALKLVVRAAAVARCVEGGEQAQAKEEGGEGMRTVVMWRAHSCSSLPTSMPLVMPLNTLCVQCAVAHTAQHGERGMAAEAPR